VSPKHEDYFPFGLRVQKTFTVGDIAKGMKIETILRKYNIKEPF
jgi:hypothetical protein